MEDDRVGPSFFKIRKMKNKLSVISKGMMVIGGLSIISFVFYGVSVMLIHCDDNRPLLCWESEWLGASFIAFFGGALLFGISKGLINHVYKFITEE